MPTITLCDADGTTIISEGEGVVYGFGLPRVYCKEAEPAVDAYVNGLQAAAEDARELYRERRADLALKFHKEYPDGKLPDVD